MSGGVDSSVAAAELVDAGHDVVGVTMRLWGGDSDTGCCSVADVDDARRVAQQLGIDHLVFNFSDDFDAPRRRPVRRRPRARAHAEPVHRVQPPPQVRPAQRARRPARLRRRRHRPPRPSSKRSATAASSHRGADAAKDQSYVVHMLPQRELRRTLFPVGHLTKAEVRDRAAALGLRTAAKPDSQDVCFITQTGGREAFLGAADPVPQRHRRRPRRRRCSVTVPCDRAGHLRPAPRHRPARRWPEAVRHRRRPRHGDGGRRRRGRSATTTELAVDDMVWADEPVRRRGDGAVQRPRRRPCPPTCGAGTVRVACDRSAASRPARASCSTTPSNRYVLGGGIAPDREAPVWSVSAPTRVA